VGRNKKDLFIKDIMKAYAWGLEGNQIMGLGNEPAY
jgi:hypothetical protein